MLKIKPIVEEEGRDPSRIAPKSFRITLSTHAEEAGVHPEAINELGGWAKGSRMPSEVYSRACTSSGLAMVELSGKSEEAIKSGSSSC